MRRSATLALTALVLAACGSSAHTTATTTTTAAPSNTQTTTPSLDTIEHWATTWCTLSTSMTKEQLIAAMGKPNATFGGSTPQIGWEAADFHITAFFDD